MRMCCVRARTDVVSGRQGLSGNMAERGLKSVLFVCLGKGILS